MTYTVLRTFKEKINFFYKNSLETYKKSSNILSKALKSTFYNFRKNQNQTSKNWISVILGVNPQAPVAQKVADEVVFRRFGGKGVDFF